MQESSEEDSLESGKDVEKVVLGNFSSLLGQIKKSNLKKQDDGQVVGVGLGHKHRTPTGLYLSSRQFPRIKDIRAELDEERSEFIDILLEYRGIDSASKQASPTHGDRP